MTRYGMVIDLQKCVGCGACALACKTQNNTPERANGQTFNWADFLFEAKGAYPNVDFSAIPVLCNHCSKPKCVEICPVTPKAMYKTDDGMTMHDPKLCIGCQKCQYACPYSVLDVDEEKVQYSVISYNDGDEGQFAAYKTAGALIEKCTTSGAELAKRTGHKLPHQMEWDYPRYESVRRADVVEKCNFCAPRVKSGDAPWCVVCCPSGARIFGDLDDAGSVPRKALAKHDSFRLKEEAGTKPNVHYIRSFYRKP